MRPEKANIVSDLSEKLNRSPFLLVTDYQRMKVDQFGELRNRLAPAGAEVHVVKNSFLKRAMTRFRPAGRRRQAQRANRDRDGRERCRAGGEDSEDFRGGIQNRRAQDRCRRQERSCRPRMWRRWPNCLRAKSLLSQFLGVALGAGDEIGPRFERAGVAFAACASEGCLEAPKAGRSEGSTEARRRRAPEANEEVLQRQRQRNSCGRINHRRTS